MTPDEPASNPQALPQQRFGERHRWRVLLTVMIGAMASIMASTIVNVAVPDMSRVFMLGQERAQWLSAGFMAAMTLSMLTTPWLLERFGYRSTFNGAIVLLGLGGACGGLAGSFEMVIAMRVVEGLSAGVLQPIPAIVILRAFGPAEQGRAMGVFGFGVVLAPALGPTIGGVLVEAYGWRSIFFVVLPFCLAALGLARSTLPVADPGAAALLRGAARLDVVGLGWIVAAVLSLLNGLVHLHAGERGIAIGLLVCSAVTTALFVRQQRRQARPLMELRLYSHRNFALGGVVSFVYGTALFGSTYLVPVFMQIALGLPPSQAGAVLLPAGLVLAVTIPLAGRLADRLPVAKLVSAGLLLMALSFALMLAVGSGTALGVIALWAIVGRIGLGFVMPSLNLGAMRGLPMDLIAQGSSNVSFLRQLGGAVGISLTGSVLEWRLQALPGAPLTAFHQTFALLAAVTAAAMVAAWHMAPRGSAARAA